MRHEIKGFDDGQIGAAPRRRRPRKLSQLFAELSAEAKGPVTVAEIRDALGDRSFAALLVFFALLNMIPLPPPSSAILGLPMVIVAAQLMYGSKRAWLPAFVMNKSLSLEQFRGLMDRLIPFLIRLEQYVRPRYWPFWRRRGDRVVGAMAFFLAIIVTLPIPLGNWLPAFSTALLGLSLSERDGLVFGIATIVGVGAIAVIVAVIGVAGAATHAFLGWMF